MGHGIAQVFAQAGHEVRLVDQWEKALESGMSKVQSNLAVVVQLGILTESQSREIFSRIHPSTEMGKAFGDVEFVTEAVFENLNLKEEIFRRLDSVVPAKVILASNTSGLNITQIASAVKNPARVVGTNWWNPPNIVPLVEIMRGERTSEETVKRTKEILMSVGKKPILISKPSPGFVGNRLQIALLREALSLLQKGVASVEDIDTAVRYGLGIRYATMGPFKVADLGGLDVFHHLAQELYKDLDCSEEPQAILSELVNSQKIGLKAGSGFYDYPKDESGRVLAERDRLLLKILRTMS
jgi:3-hydroxybutyryl-CoA dehydrogenase